MKHGTLFTVEGKSFRFCHEYDGGSGGFELVAEACDPTIDPFAETWGWRHMHDDYFFFYFDEVEPVDPDAPQIHQGMYI